MRHKEDIEGERNTQCHHYQGQHHLMLIENAKSEVAGHKNCCGKESHKRDAHIDDGVLQGHHQLHPVSRLLTPTGFCGFECVEGEHGKDKDAWMGEKGSRRAGEGAGEET